MDAIRCLDCGDVRWSLMGLTGRPGACIVCGGEMVTERRRPVTGPHLTPRERRDLARARETASPGARATA